MLSLVVLAISVVCSTAIHCEGDVDLEDEPQSWRQDIANAGEFEYWRTRQQNFQAYGKFDGSPDSTLIKAGYYTDDDKLIEGIQVDCGAKTWSLLVTDNETKSDDVITTFQHGALEKECADGDEFDIFLKIHQPYLMNWAFNGQAMQTGTRQHQKWNGKVRITARKAPTKYSSDKAAYFKVEGTGAAKYTRGSWGQCNTWPHSTSSDCREAKNWTLARSKLKTGLSRHGMHNQHFIPSCYMGSRYFHYLQHSVHPDKNSGELGRSYCCCTDMETGQTILNDDGSERCQLLTPQPVLGCNLNCEAAADHDIILAVNAEMNSKRTL